MTIAVAKDVGRRAARRGDRRLQRILVRCMRGMRMVLARGERGGAGHEGEAEAEKILQRTGWRIILRSLDRRMEATRMEQK